MMVEIDDRSGEIETLRVNDEFDINDVKHYPVNILVEHRGGAGIILSFVYRYKLEEYLLKRKYLREHLKPDQRLSSIRIWD